MPSNALGELAKSWFFGSSSNPAKKYETIRYTKGSTSCDCPGWTRRTGSDGSRSCKHTRAVDQDVADQTALSCKDYRTEEVKAPLKTTTKKTVVPVSNIEESVPVAKVRKIQW